MIEELTVYENIALSLDLNQIEDDGLVSKALKEVDLAGYEDRFPNELSGGERQRVAIARAIIKKPKLILADEPTGNLDTTTACQIIELLKKLSKECLILIVSHNQNDAYKYGDRIVSLSLGKVISDISKNELFNDKLFIKNKNLYYPCDKVLSLDDIDIINDNLKNNNIDNFIIVNEKYIDSKISDDKMNKIEIKKSKFSFTKTLKLSLKFLKNKIFRIVTSSFISSVILVILALSLTIITFDSGSIIKDELTKQNTQDVVFEKSSFKDEEKNLSSTHIFEIEEDDIESFRQHGYKGEIYKLYSPSLYISNNALSYGRKATYLTMNSPYVSCTLGTLVCNENYIIERFGEFELIKEAEVYEKSGVYLTDYVADAMLLANKKYNSYDDVLGMHKPVSVSYGYVNGIIKTDYKEKFKGVFDFYKDLDNEKIKEFVQTPIYEQFYDYVINYLSIGYSFEEDFIDHFNSSKYNTWIGFLGNLEIEHAGKTYDINSTYAQSLEINNLELSGNECAFSTTKYNNLFGTNYNGTNLNNFKPHTIKVSFYQNNDLEKTNKKLTLELYIKQLYVPTNSSILTLSQEMFTKVAASNFVCYSLYFTNVDEIDVLNEVALKNGYSIKSYITSALLTMTKAVDVFIPMFKLIGIVLCLGIVLILTNFGIKMIKDKYHEIGILKAIGTQNRAIETIFGIQVCLIALFTIILSSLGYYLFIDLANDVLVSSLKELAPGHVVLDLNFLIFSLDVLIFDTVLILLLCVVALLIPLIKIKNIKPVKIIKTKE